MPHYVILSSSAKMPASVKAPYRHIAIVQLREPEPIPRMISTRHRNVIDIPFIWRNLHAGWNPDSPTAYKRQMAEAEKIVAMLNNRLTG